MDSELIQKQRPAWTWAPSLAPLTLFVGILSMAAHVRLGLGRWPVPMIESYDTAAYRRHEMAVFGIMIAALYVALPLWGVLLISPKLRLGARKHALQIAVFFSGFMLIYLAAKFDPTPFTEWFLD